MKTPENLWFSGVFRGYVIETLTRNRVSMKNHVVISFKSVQPIFGGYGMELSALDKTSTCAMIHGKKKQNVLLTLLSPRIPSEWDYKSISFFFLVFAFDLFKTGHKSLPYPSYELFL